ncbi:hypothetical protein JQC67_17260 [Aurantibacter crassamenti]|uniref:hypothetical protein n=1 Tax=Aurantibacter crassamenti TaxID=1837375 RepID=UPI00193A717D|nr:hypothetical protein [Aurantibacter crassamenti]MBM1107907.1 hypothetical protein [Aurantibacter crassamenti]
MKTFLISLIILAFVTISHAQGNNSVPNLEIKLENNKTTLINTNYLSKINEETVSPRVLELQHIAAHFNLSKSSIYKGKGSNYVVSFKKTNGEILATFNDRGIILYSMGKFKDVILHMPVRNTIYKTHPGWFVLTSTYKTSYSIEAGVENIYRVKIGKGELQKRLRIDVEGNLL